MKRTFQTIVIGASMAVGVSAIATAPAHATSFTFNNPSQIRTYDSTNGTFIANDTAAASRALNDHNVTSNVELWYTTENPLENVGFTATKGNYSATVSSVKASDWSNFGSQWLNDLFTQYTDFKPTWDGFSESTRTSVTSSFALLALGDPNIGSFQFGENGGVELKLIGHLDVKSRLSATLDTTLSSSWNALKLVLTTAQKTAFFPGVTNSPTLAQVNSALLLLPPTSANATRRAALTSLKDLLTLQVTLNNFQGEIGASEIAKVVIGDKTHYAYSFNPSASGITASDDGVSYSAIYTWQTDGFVAAVRHVPEPSVILGLLGVAGVFGVKRKFKKASA